MGKRGGTLAAVLLAAALTGCSSDEKVVVPLGTAPPGPPVSVAKPDETGMVPLRKWPVACDLLTEADIRAILPSTTTLKRKQSAVTFQNWSVSNPGQVGVPNAGCWNEVSFPGGTEDGLTKVIINVTVRVAGTAEVAQSNFGDYISHGEKDTCPASVRDLRLDDCYHSGTDWAVLKHGVAVQVKVYPPHLDGSFEGQPEGGNYHHFWRDEVAPRFVRAVAARLP